MDTLELVLAQLARSMMQTLDELVAGVVAEIDVVLRCLSQRLPEFAMFIEIDDVIVGSHGRSKMFKSLVDRDEHFL